MRTIIISNQGNEPGPNSQRKIKAICPKGHTHQITANLAKSHGCPVCAGNHIQQKGS
jgi:hypothetical protein